VVSEAAFADIVEVVLVVWYVHVWVRACGCDGECTCTCVWGVMMVGKAGLF